MSEGINELEMKRKPHKYNNTATTFFIVLKMTFFLTVFVNYSRAAEPKFRFHGEVSKPCFHWGFWSWLVWLFVTGFTDSSSNESCFTLQVLQPPVRQLYIIFYITVLYYNTTLDSDRLHTESQSWILLCCCGWFIVLEYRIYCEA